ncbi:DUF6886 family protein [Dermacoccaceae bacterium W4C1]
MADALLGPGVQRVHSIESGWEPAMHSTELFAYRFRRAEFRAYEDFAHVSDRARTPLGRPLALGSPADLHRDTTIQLRVMPNMFGWWEKVLDSGLGFSGIRLSNSPHYPGS